MIKQELKRMLFFIWIATFLFSTIYETSLFNHKNVQASDQKLGTWSDYNSVIFGDVTIHNASLGGNFAVGGAISLQNNFLIGSTHSSVYDPTLHRGEYVNNGDFPSFLFGGNNLNVAPNVNNLDVIGGSIAMTDAMLTQNSQLPIGFTPSGAASNYQTVSEEVMERWFSQQHEVAKMTSELYVTANDERVSLTVDRNDFVNNAYMAQGPDRFENQRLTINGQVHEKALFITVNTDANLELGTWWPLASSLQINSNWVRDYDLVVFSFPDAMNVSMEQQSLMPDSAVPWPTTVDAHIGAEGLEIRENFASKVIYNFPHAENITSNQAMIHGSLLAPNATFRGIGGDASMVFGRLIAKEYIAENNFSVHDYSKTSIAEEIVEENIVPTERTGSILLNQHLFFRGESVHAPIGGGEFILLRTEEGRESYYAGNGVFVADEAAASVYTVSSEAETIIADVPLGSYILRQIRAPEGFTLNKTNQDYPTYFEQIVQLSRNHEQVEVLQYIELESTDLHFIKVDADNHALGLAGAKFELIREGDQYANTLLWGEYNSSTNGQFKVPDLPIGTYHLVEIESPEGYQISGEAFSFSVQWDNGVKVLDDHQVELSATNDSPIEIENTKGIPEHSVVVVKYAVNVEDADDKTATLPNAKFDLYKKNEQDSWEQVTENAIGETIVFETNALGYYRVENLPTGIYRLVETVSPVGYALYNEHADEDFPGGRYAYEFEFSETGSSSNQYLAYIPNAALTTSVAVRNVGLFLADLQPLSGAEFQLERQVDHGASWEGGSPYQSVVTNEQGEFHLTGLIYGSYRLTQTQARLGYAPLTPARIFFTIEFDSDGKPTVEVRYNGEVLHGNSAPVSVSNGDQTIITVENKPNKVDFSVYKNAAYENMEEQLIHYLEGATFRLRYRENSSLPWRDYGKAFTSQHLYDGGQPVVDGYGNHVAAAKFQGGLLAGFYYSLVEVETPENYQTASKLEVTLEDGTTGYEIQQYFVTEAMTGDNSRFSYTVVNYPEMELLTVQHLDSSNKALAAKETYEVRKGQALDVADYVLEIEGHLGAYYKVGEVQHDITTPLMIQQATEIEIYYASTVVSLSFPSKIEFYAYYSDEGAVTSANYEIVNESELPCTVNFKELIVAEQEAAGIDFVAQATATDEMHLNLDLPESVANNAFQATVPNIVPNEELNKKLGVLDGTIRDGNEKTGTFVIGGQYVGSFTGISRNPRVSFVFSFALNEFERR